MPFAPIPSAPAENPYVETPLQALEVGVTTRDDAIARLGQAPIIRRDGRLLIYGAGRERGGRILFIAPPFIPVTIPEEEFHFLFLDFDAAGILRARELVVARNLDSDACDSQGRCIRDIEWNTEGAFPFWAKTGDVKGGERAVVTASRRDETQARAMDLPASGCTLYFFGRERKPTWYEELVGNIAGVVYYAIDDQPRYRDVRHELFAVWHVGAGPHRMTATTSNEEVRAEFPFECADGELLVIAAETIPTVAGMNPELRFSFVARPQAAQEIASRRLLLQ